MANTTESKETVSRKEFATYLRSLADQFESDGDAQIQVGNKSVTVHPADSLTCEVTVMERSAILRGDKEALDLEVKWKKRKKSGGTGESESRDEGESEPESERESDPETESERESGRETETGRGSGDD